MSSPLVSRPTWRIKRSTTLVLLLALTPLVCDSATRTFTARDGRTIEEEILGYKGDILWVRRTDTGKEFQLPIPSLADSDQIEVRDFVSQYPDLRDTVAPEQMRVEFSRTRFETDRTKGAFYDVNVEHWGYRITITNLASVPLEGLRVEHLVFAELDPDGARSGASDKPYERNAGQTTLEPIPAQSRSSAITEAVICRTDKLDDGSRWITDKGLKSKIRDRTLHGVWFRIYDGDKVIHEISSPASLRTTERWTSTGQD